MNLQQIHDIAADALAGEELQFKSDEAGWVTIANTAVRILHPNFEWRIKPTVEVNGVMLTKRQAKAAWGLSGATSYERMEALSTWIRGRNNTPDFDSGMHYRWQEPKWIYVNGEKIVRLAENSSRKYMGFGVATEGDLCRFSVALKALIEIK